MTIPQSAEAEPKPMPRTVSVLASGQVQAEPDTAHLSTGVASEGKTAGEALAKNSQSMRKVVDGLKASGIDPKDIQTVSFNVSPRHQHFKDGRPPAVVGYEVHNQVRVVVRDLKQLGKILDEVVTLGANQVHGITFEVGRQEELKDEARKSAMQSALRRAKLYADAAGATVGPVVTIAEEMPNFVPSRPIMFAKAAADSAPPVEAGTQMLEVKVSVTWELR